MFKFTFTFNGSFLTVSIILFVVLVAIPILIKTDMECVGSSSRKFPDGILNSSGGTRRRGG